MGTSLTQCIFRRYVIVPRRFSPLTPGHQVPSRNSTLRPVNTVRKLFFSGTDLGLSYDSVREIVLITQVTRSSKACTWIFF